MTVITYVIDRDAGDFATSYDVWAKYNGMPESDGDGVFVETATADPGDTEVRGTYDTPNDSTNWYFYAVPKYLDQVGFGGGLNS